MSNTVKHWVNMAAAAYRSGDQHIIDIFEELATHYGFICKHDLRPDGVDYYLNDICVHSFNRMGRYYV